MNSTATKPSNADLLKNWCGNYATNDAGPLSRVIIRTDGPDVKVQAVGIGFPDENALGEATAQVYFAEGRTPRLTATFTNPSAHCMLVICLSSGGNPTGNSLIDCSLYTKYTDSRGQQFSDQRFSTERTASA